MKPLESLTEEYRSLIDSSNDAIVLLDRLGRFKIVNKKVLNSTGYKESELIGKHFEKIVPAEYLSKCFELFKQQLKSSKPTIATIEIRTKNGKLIPIELKGSVAKNKGKIIGVNVIAKDLTELKEAEEELKISEERFRNLTENAPIGIYYNDFDGTFLYGNRMVEEMFGYKSEEIIGKNFLKLQLVDSDDFANIVKLFTLKIAGKATRPKEFLLKRKDGTKRTIEISNKIIDIHGKKAVLGIVQDITDRKKTEKELKKAHEDLKVSYENLKELDSKKNEFISIAAHELKTPLTAIHSFSQILQDKKICVDTEKMQKYMKIIEEETKRLENLVTKILDLSEIDAGIMKIKLENLNLYKFVDELALEVEPLVKKSKLKLEYYTDRNFPEILIDKEKLRQIFLNLIVNAIKYTPKGKITIKANKENERIHFQIKDTGIGIAKKHQKLIFKRFYQVESPYTRKITGSGLGLSICEELVELMGGKIWVESKLKRGSVFHFTLPMKSKM